MEYIEFSDLKIDLSVSSLIPKFILDDGSSFFMEPSFYSQLQGVKSRFKERYNEVINSLLNIVKKHHKVYFTSNFEEYLLDVDGYIYLEIEDILNPLNIFPEDKSRGSDYGD